jgi:hypothetical protein
MDCVSFSVLFEELVVALLAVFVVASAWIGVTFIRMSFQTNTFSSEPESPAHG